MASASISSWVSGVVSLVESLGLFKNREVWYNSWSERAGSSAG